MADITIHFVPRSRDIFRHDPPNASLEIYLSFYRVSHLEKLTTSVKEILQIKLDFVSAVSFDQAAVVSSSFLENCLTEERWLCHRHISADKLKKRKKKRKRELLELVNLRQSRKKENIRCSLNWNNREIITLGTRIRWENFHFRRVSNRSKIISRL